MLTVQLGNHRICIFNSAGEFLRTFGEQSLLAEVGKFHFPWAVVLDKDGKIVVSDAANGRLQVFTTNGLFLKQIGMKGIDEGRLSNPYWPCLDWEGNLVIPEASGQRISVFG